MFHKHIWKEIARTYAEPRSGFNGSYICTDTLEKLSFGVTTILWECQVCQEIRKEEMLGKEVKS